MLGRPRAVGAATLSDVFLAVGLRCGFALRVSGAWCGTCVRRNPERDGAVIRSFPADVIVRHGDHRDSWLVHRL